MFICMQVASVSRWDVQLSVLNMVMNGVLRCNMRDELSGLQVDASIIT